ncbi:MAG: polysaccharide biosynthesis protein [Lachnospiraceae bacterium]|nr:polysaccharide biosynthesis protein [Lachnospiraceae bacterium]
MQRKNAADKPKKANAYLSASFVYILANGLGQGTTLLTNSFFSRYMSKADYGMYSTYYSYVALLVPFVGLNLYVGLTNAYIDYKKDIHKLRSSVMMLSLLGLLVTSLFWIGWKGLIGLKLPWSCVFLSLIHAYGFFLVNYHITSMNMENRFMAKGLMLAIPNILQALLAVLALLICNSLLFRAIGATAGIFVCGLVAAFLILKAEKPSFRPDYWKYVLRISLPAIIGSVAAMIMQQCDKVMITGLLNEEETAVYALVFNVGYILYAVEQATGGVWDVWLYNAMDRKEYGTIPVVQKWYMYIMLVLATGLYMIAPEIVKVLSPPDYWQFDYVLPFVAGSYLMLMYVVSLSVVRYEKKTAISAAIVAAAALINVVLNYLLIPRYGGVGAAYTSVVSYLFIFLAGTVYLLRRKWYYFRMRYFLVCFFMVIALGLLFNALKDMILMRYVVYLILLAGEALYVLVKKDELFALFGGRFLKRDK